MIIPFGEAVNLYQPTREFEPDQLELLHLIAQQAVALEEGDYTSRLLPKSAEVQQGGPASRILYCERLLLTGQTRETEINVIRALPDFERVDPPAVTATEVTLKGSVSRASDPQIRLFGSTNPDWVNSLPLSRISRILRIVGHLPPLDVA